MASKELVLVTGASGFIAAHVVQQLLAAGYRVRGTVRSLSNKHKVAPIRALGTPDVLELVEADLLQEDCWKRMVEGCQYVCHTASPFPLEAPEDENELIGPAVNGTLFVLRACKGAGIRRVVVTSSTASVSGVDGKGDAYVYTEKDWSDPATSTPYPKSKTLAERAAWEFMEQEKPDFELTCVNPCLVVGPMLTTALSTSGEIFKKLLLREMPAVPYLHFNLVDVRDVAAAHVSALTAANAAGNRYILFGSEAWLPEIAKAVSDVFSPMGYSVPTMGLPKAALWVASFFDSTAATALNNIGSRKQLSSAKATEDLGLTFRPCLPSCIDISHSLIENGHVKRTPGYKAPEKASL